MKLSIITINYNDANNLRSTCKSVSDSIIQAEAFNSVEHIIVDGMSTDGSQEIIKQYCADVKHKTVWISQSDNGIYDAMNKGSELASGSFIQFLNAGDTLITKNFQVIINTLDMCAKKTDVICFAYVKGMVDKLSKPIYPQKKVSNLFLRMPTSHQAIFYRRAVFNDIKYDVKFQISGDFNHFCKLINANKVVESNDTLAIKFTLGGISSVHKKMLFWESARSILRYNSVATIPIRLIILAARIFM